MNTIIEDTLPEEETRPASLYTSLFFGLVFTGLAGLMAYLTYLKLLEEPPALFGLPLLSFTVIVFGGIGIMILWGVFTWKSSSKKFSLTTSLQHEWDSGVILSSSKSKFLAFGLLSLVIFLSLLPSLYLVIREITLGTEDIETISWLAVIIFPIVPLFLSLRSGLQLFRYGESTCRLPQGPGAIGSNLRVIVSTSKKIGATGNFKGTLSCTATLLEEKEGQNQIIVKNLFESTKEIPYQSNHSVSGITFDFSIPRDLPPSDAAGAHAKTKWNLLVEAPTKTLDFKTNFLVPVINKTVSS